MRYPRERAMARLTVSVLVMHVLLSLPYIAVAAVSWVNIAQVMKLVGIW